VPFTPNTGCSFSVTERGTFALLLTGCHAYGGHCTDQPALRRFVWGLEHAMPILGKRANLPVGCLPLIAALTPPEHTVKIIDENVEEIDFDRLVHADIVALTGMSVQRLRMREILETLKLHGVFTVVGGPWVTVQEDYFEDVTDVIFVGEAEETWPQFLNEWQQGLQQYRYEQLEKSDMRKVPVPRFDLVKSEHYMFGSLQFSRGCPFQCEFCDIIVTFGRQPRLKTSEQVIAEIEALRVQNMHTVFVVDDNLIGNKKEIKKVLRAVILWQKATNHCMTFFTEASLDLADDEELMQLMVEANFVSVFIGIESPNEESLRETKKFQNMRDGRSMIEKVYVIQDIGLDVWCGMIVGFDNDDTSIFDMQREFLERARISQAMLGMLHAIPKTPLHARLAEEGRLDLDDQPEFGTNVVPLGMTREELRDGYIDLMYDLYTPEAYFDRLDKLFLKGHFQLSPGRWQYWYKQPWTALKAKFMAVAAFVYVYQRLERHIPDAALRSEYRRRIVGLLKKRRDPGLMYVYTIKCALHYHYHTLAKEMVQSKTRVVSNFF